MHLLSSFQTYLNLSTMFLLRSRMIVGRLFRVTGSSLAETGPRVSAVKLMHAIQMFNNGEKFVTQKLNVTKMSQVSTSKCRSSTQPGETSL